MNIPIYRAKKIDSDEYVIGNYIKVHNKFYIYEDGTSDIYLDDEVCFDDGSIDGEIRIIDLIFEIDPTTLAIHFLDMLDSQGNKIFASLSITGKGRDIEELSNSEHSLHKNIGLKDINGKSIYADRSIVEFNHLDRGLYRGVFFWDSDKLRYSIYLVAESLKYKSIAWDYDNTNIGDFKIIDTIQENKLGLIK